MIGRVTTRSIAMNSLNNLQTSQTRSAQLQEQLTSGNKYTRGSQDPAAAAQARELHQQVGLNAQYSRNVTDAQAWMTTQENALDDANDLMKRVRDLTVQAASTGTTDTAGRESIAKELSEIKTSLLGLSNTSYQGHPVFGGTTNESAAYKDNGDGTYTANDDGGTVVRTVSAGVNMQVNVAGSSAFGDSTSNVFSELDSLISTVRSGDGNAITAQLTTVDSRLGSLTGALTSVGAKSNQLDAAKTTNTNQSAFLTDRLEDVEGVDFAKTMVEYSTQSVAYQAALQATAKVIQPTLMDFLS